MAAPSKHPTDGDFGNIHHSFIQGSLFSDVTHSINIVHTRKFFKMYKNVVPFRFVFGIAKWIVFEHQRVVATVFHNSVLRQLMVLEIYRQ